MVYVKRGSGKRQIGNHISHYTDGDLILVGSNLTHCSFTNDQTGNQYETEIQMKPDFLGRNFFDVQEVKNILNLFKQAEVGITFDGETKKKMESK